MKYTFGLSIIFLCMFSLHSMEEMHVVIKAAKEFDDKLEYASFTNINPELLYKCIELRALQENQEGKFSVEKQIIFRGDSKKTLYCLPAANHTISYHHIRHNIGRMDNQPPHVSISLHASYKQNITPLTFVLCKKNQQKILEIEHLNHVLYYSDKPSSFDHEFYNHPMLAIITPQNDESCPGLSNWLNPEMRRALVQHYKDASDETCVSFVSWNNGSHSCEPLSVLRALDKKMKPY